MQVEAPLEAGELDNEAEHDHDAEHGQHEAHADLAAEYRFECAVPDRLRHPGLCLIAAFAGMQRVQVQYVGPAGQAAAELTPTNAELPSDQGPLRGVSATRGCRPPRPVGLLARHALAQRRGGARGSADGDADYTTTQMAGAKVTIPHPSVDQAALAAALARAETLCIERGVRLTEQRRQVLEIVCRAERPLGAYEILDALRDQVKRPAPTLVYRALDFLLEQGLIHRLETLHAFIGCIHPEHPHASQFLICSDCGGVRELEDASIQSSLQEAAVRSDFIPKRRVVEVIGTCAACAHRADAGGTM